VRPGGEGVVVRARARGGHDQVAHLAHVEEHEAVSGVLLGEAGRGCWLAVPAGVCPCLAASHLLPRRS
jgi:hypothetical protein